MKKPHSGMIYDDCYRTEPRAKIIQMIKLISFAYEPESAEANAQTRAALNRWTQTGLAVRLSRSGEQLFDPVEVTNFMRQAAFDGRDLFWGETYVPTCRRMVRQMAAFDRTSSFIVDFRRTYHFAGNAPRKSVRLRMPLPLKSVHGDSLHVAPTLDGLPDPKVTVTDGRLEARSTVGAGNHLVTVGATLMFDPPKPDAHLKDPSIYLKVKEGFVVVTNRIHDLSAALAGPGASTGHAVRAFWDYIRDNLRCGALHYDQIDMAAPCDWILDIGWYDCQLISALFVALCRARGIPARQISGYLLYAVSPTIHYWAEVWFENEGWKPFDFMSLDYALGTSDMEWQDRFFGRIDHRMITQRLPFEFTGAVGIPIPHAWHIIQVPHADGIAIDLTDLASNPVFSDFVSVRGESRNATPLLPHTAISL